MRKILVLVGTATFLFSFSQKTMNPTAYKSSSKVFSIKGLSQSVSIDCGSAAMILLSGQVPLDSEGNLVGKNVEEQTQQVFKNIENILKEYGGTGKDVVKLGIFMTDISKAPDFRKVRDMYVNLQNPPVSSLVEVSRLFRDDVLIEVEATAVIKNK
ncbi:RidA family protein [Chryseobacterium arthrosphaerae]|uniref:Endoribonuclease L-PSP n=1 Tax=Chryseobacterium arthrosphaerae TaxID=651561 RepID=A0A1B8ZUA5_9FLAO|nr:RidA family protein [Chryseobacterium arthrosphaerae]AYZ13604.1 RidA family protein [Chryseobacterium arthrosphaerae]MDG4653104.1 RidA family protein [Chryseobacterium arthrosphaerae]OCA75170.1 endoribonuclease L-PSP [Chryseobacterium arthrosphaerae]QUY54430.1 RidA family protein [Chryseobacterium arthrosphaerae]UEQ78906.1 RidA family protein [Chryseobacterium arthrosphaerae]